MIEVTIDDKEMKKALHRLASHAANPAPALRAIGNDLVESTKKRFASSTAPNGTKWKPNKQSTLDNKTGSKPLIHHGTLANFTISYQLHGNNTLLVGSSSEYAAMQNFGGKKSDYPHLWGDIPARQFIGLSPADETNILQTIATFITS